jgi:hypothetical protein
MKMPFQKLLIDELQVENIYDEVKTETLHEVIALRLISIDGMVILLKIDTVMFI